MPTGQPSDLEKDDMYRGEPPKRRYERLQAKLDDWLIFPQATLPKKAVPILDAVKDAAKIKRLLFFRTIGGVITTLAIVAYEKLTGKRPKNKPRPEKPQ